MAERLRSQDGTRETKEVLGEAPEDLPETPSGQGSAGGEMQRKLGTRDEKKHYDSTDPGNTRVTGQDQDGSGDKENM
ncbi:hypothetical protein ERN12_01215 [Rhodobacteraceae bacterium]|nr:hypothetical protein ERN12_01215 [Paracoccaceae bacterium]